MTPPSLESWELNRCICSRIRAFTHYARGSQPARAGTLRGRRGLTPRPTATRTITGVEGRLNQSLLLKAGLSRLWLCDLGELFTLSVHFSLSVRCGLPYLLAERQQRLAEMTHAGHRLRGSRCSAAHGFSKMRSTLRQEML